MWITANDLIAEQAHPDPDRRHLAWTATASLMLLAQVRVQKRGTTYEDEWARVFEEATMRGECERDDALGLAAADAVDDLQDIIDLRAEAGIVASPQERLWAETTRARMLESINEWRRANL